MLSFDWLLFLFRRIQPKQSDICSVVYHAFIDEFRQTFGTAVSAVIVVWSPRMNIPRKANVKSTMIIKVMNTNIEIKSKFLITNNVS